MKPASLLVLVLVASTIAGCVRLPRKEAGPGRQADPEVRVIPLPERRAAGQLPVEAAIYRRLSRRSYLPGSLTLSEAGQLLWAAGGVGVDGVTGATRTAPSAGATHPLELYLVAGAVDGLTPGVYRYNWYAHALEPVRAGDLRAELARAALGQEMVAEAPATVVIAAYFPRTIRRYGDRGVRYVYMEVGFAAQNLHLQVESLNLGTVAIGAFDDAATKRILGIEHDPLLLMPVGRRR